MSPAQQGDTRRVDRGRGHTYLLDGQKVPGVTSIIKGGMPKPALINWAGNTVAAHAVDHWDDLAQLPHSERLKRLQGAPRADRDAAANRGTQVHGLADALVRGEEVAVPEELAGHVDSYLRFLDDWQVEPLLVEVSVFSRRWRYGGTLDLIADLAGGGRWLLDIKTSRSGPFGEVSAQLAGYRYADIYLDDDGVEHPMPEVQRCGVVWVRSDGYDLIPFEAGRAEHRALLHMAQVMAFVERARDLRGDALEPSGRTAVPA